MKRAIIAAALLASVIVPAAQAATRHSQHHGKSNLQQIVSHAQQKALSKQAPPYNGLADVNDE